MNTNILLNLCLLLSSVVYTNSQSDVGHCQTPDNRNGICVRLKYCDNLYQMRHNNPLSPEDRNFLIRSLCGNQQSHVCCLFTEVSKRKTITNPLGPPIIPPTTPTRIPSTTPTRIPTTTPKRPLPTGRRSEPIHEPIRISAQKCKDYAEYAYNKTYIQTPITGIRVVKRSNCALSRIGLVTEGEIAKWREFPHMALIGYLKTRQTVWGCGGSLISELFVLSAEHCNQTNFGPASYVRLGEHDLSTTDDAPHIDFNIIASYRHNVPWSTYNDIVLFKLDREVVFNHAIRPACLPEQLDVPYRLIASGWGADQSQKRSDVLLRVELESFSHSESMSTSIGREMARRYNSQTIVFAGHHTENKDTCEGDSGGPLQNFHKTYNCTYTVFGVVSTGRYCGYSGTPAVYTRVYSHLNWIEQIVWPNE